MAGYGARYWADRTPANRRRTYPAFRGDVEVEVVVIGGGLTGCAAAYALGAAGIRTILLESERLAGGATAGGLGVLMPEPPAPLAVVEQEAGKRRAHAAWKDAHRSAREFAALLKKLSARTEVLPSTFLVNAGSAADAVVLRREHTMRKAASVETPWLTAAAARGHLGADSAGAIRVPDAATFDPVRATIALAAAAESKGVKIFERSEVTKTTFTRKDAEVVLRAGKIRARGVLVATGEPGELFGQLQRHVRRLEGFAVVTHPLPSAMRREIKTDGGIWTEVGDTPHWLRWLRDDRILFAGAASDPVTPRQLDKAIVNRTAQLMYELSVRYPVISGLPAEWGWNVPVVTTSDRLPWIGTHRNYPHHFFAIASGWHGDGMVWLAAKEAVKHFKGLD